MNEQEKQSLINASLEMIGTLDSAIEYCSELYNLDQSDITSEVWAGVKQSMPGIAILLEMHKKMLMLGSQFIDNDALLSHLNASVDLDKL